MTREEAKKVFEYLEKKANTQEPCEVSEYDKDHIWYKGKQYISLHRFLEVKAEAEQEPICDRDCEHCTWTECPIEPCDDAIDREYLFKVLDDFCGHDRTATITLDTLADLVYDMPSVTQKSGKWIDINGIYAECSNCNEEIYITGDFKYCPNCGAKMERSDKE